MQIAAGLTGRAQSDGRIRIVARPIHRRMTSDERLFYVHIGIATGRESRLRGLEVERLVAILGVRISPRPTLRLVSADGRLGPGDIQIRRHIES